MATIDYTITDNEMLAAACMPFVIRGGLFLEVKEDYPLGTALTIQLQLLTDPELLVFSGTVIWLTPANESDQWPQGIGVQFSDEDSKCVRTAIEAILPEVFSGSGFFA